MEAKRTRLIRRRKTIAYSGRGTIYSCLRAHYTQIRDLRVGEERPWAEILADLHEDLRALGESGAASLKNVCNIWQRVCRDVDAAPQRQKRLMPSRLPRDWRPQVVPPAELAGAAGSALVPSQSRSLRIGEVGPRPPPIDMDAPLEFPTVDPAGNPLEEGWVFYRGKAMTRRAAGQIEQISRAFREKDRGV